MSWMNRIHRAAALSLMVFVIPAGASCAENAPSSRAKPKVATPATAVARPAAPGAGIATFAGGCFWCLETAYESLPGVSSVVSGYMGGQKDDPTYDQVSAGGTGHAEVVQIRFDPARVTYAELLDRFWHSVDPTQAGGQFCDRGDQYRSAIFWHDETQKKLAEESKGRLASSGILRKPIVTEIARATTFYAAEEYHQDFWKKDPERYRSYREGCGRDRRLAELWGKSAANPLVH